MRWSKLLRSSKTSFWNWQLKASGTTFWVGLIWLRETSYDKIADNYHSPDISLMCTGNQAPGIHTIRWLSVWQGVDIIVFCAMEAVTDRTNDFSWIRSAGVWLRRWVLWIGINTFQQDSSAAAWETSVHARRLATGRRSGSVWDVKQQMELIAASDLSLASHSYIL